MGTDGDCEYSFSSFLLTWRQFSLAPSCCETSPPSDTSGGLLLVMSLPGWAALSTPVTLAFNYSLPPASICLFFVVFHFDPMLVRFVHACQMLCFLANLC